MAACLANSLGLSLTLMVLSSGCLQLTTSLLDGYVTGQVWVSLLLVLTGYLGLVAFLVVVERLAGLAQYLGAGGCLPTDCLHSPQLTQTVRYLPLALARSQVSGGPSLLSPSLRPVSPGWRGLLLAARLLPGESMSPRARSDSPDRCPPPMLGAGGREP